MKIFVVIATRTPERVFEAIRKQGYSHFALRSDAWLIAAAGVTTRGLTENIGIRNGESGSGFVCRMESYSGRLPKDAWEWLSVNEAANE